MDADIFERLGPGDIIKGKNSGDSYVVVGDLVAATRLYILAVRQVTVANPAEWDLIYKNEHKPRPENNEV